MLRFLRGKRKVKADYMLDDAYKFYKRKYKDNTPVSKSVFRSILKECYPEIVKLIVLNNMQFRMPANLGLIYVRKKLVQPKLSEDGKLITKRLSIDWKKTKQYWEKLYEGKTPDEIAEMKDKPLIRELNEHTDGYRVHWFWDRTRSLLTNAKYYFFDMTRTHNQFLSHSVKTINNLNFYE